MNKPKKLCITALCALCAAVLTACYCYAQYHTKTTQQESTTVTIAVSYSADLTDITERYYYEWLEAESGLTIEFVYLPQSYTETYLEIMFSSKTSTIDAVFFSPADAPNAETMERYIAAGYLAPVSDYFTGNTYIEQACADFTDYDLEKAITAPDGAIYAMPALTLSSAESYLQTAWINVTWLEALGLSIPTTTEELAATLDAFAAYCPEGAAILGSADSEDTFVCNFLMNQFVSCDPSNYYFAVGADDTVTFSPTTDAWREGLSYCKACYDSGALVGENFTYNTQQLTAICNDPANCVGMFTAQDLSEIIFEDSPQLLSYFLVVPPLGEDATATSAPQLPTVGGVILAESAHKEEVFALMDLMCSEAGYFASHFGEYGVDWDYADAADVSTLGYAAVITIQNTETTTRSPYSDQLVGPFITNLYYQDRITWLGYQVNQGEYLQARAHKTYQAYEASEQLTYLAYSTGDYDTAAGQALADYVKENMIAFITGTQDITDDATWQAYCDGCAALDLAQLQAAAQTVYDAQEE